MMEILVPILTGVFGGSAISVIIVAVMAKLIDATNTTRPRAAYARAERRVLEAEAATVSVERKKIPADIRAEIDQTPAWWDSMFHKALHDSGVRVSHDPDFEPEYIAQRSWNGEVIYAEYYAGPRWLEGCICYACKQARGGSGLGRVGHLFEPATEMEKVRKLQRELSLVEDGILGPKTLRSAYRAGLPYGDDYEESWPDPAPAHPWYG